MTEEEAIFVMGKALSELRNSGEDLSTEKVLVGESWVFPDELADEYDKFFPPGPRRHKQATDKERIKTSKRNRYDVIDGDGFIFVIDKVEESISVQTGLFRIDGGTICRETPIAGNEQRDYGDWQGALRGTNFPFSKFDKFWTGWNGCVELRKRQINEVRRLMNE